MTVRRSPLAGVGAVLRGELGVLSACAVWAGVVVLLLSATVLGGPVLFVAPVVLIVLAVRAAWRGAGVLAWTAVASTGVFLAALGYLAAAFSVGIDAADAGLSVPRWTDHVVAGLIVVAVSLVVAVGFFSTAWARAAD
ncbi:hypothetical protein [Corynebacterium pygosceleis]|uniref:Uncharacterized protein n=1 Tax=Corynebacterium pygosceleis TaxID=2800406 RepID=A0A9Q4C7C3_9CORY|nr:hypothetical protein [Corynebacterium pygosceleis]MCK7637750.1 hypothetical protein [Corynebacterium pygosceleis]MCK7674941.1 hypothetical protein [Corynebacterium pygosceleis]MCL0119470.1 hypothetical protein [Corynebacterium pygosceleis]MCX7444710.1 hypothetical protein [Corynebacterium pygosceleis]MCX7467920.1 hypothetical protein [Corynebacterium pygosceleis]